MDYAELERLVDEYYYYFDAVEDGYKMKMTWKETLTKLGFVNIKYVNKPNPFRFLEVNKYLFAEQW